jgi:PAS domain S-box-containing protein
VRDAEGLPTGIAGINIDITARKEAEEELRRSKRDARTRFREVRALYQNAPVGLALLDLDTRFLRVNEFLTDITGLPAEKHVGRPLFEVLPDLGERLEPVLREVIATQEPVRDVEIEGGTPGHPGRKVWWRMHLYYMSDDYGATPGIGLVAEDVTAQKSAERARDLLGRELSHRIKNLFAVVASMVSLSARGNEALADFARTVRGRIEALGRAHDYVRPAEWGGRSGASPATLWALLDGLLAPYRGAEQGNRVEISGDDHAIGPAAATALALSIHEFATNAMKYGALSVPGGTVRIACRRDPKAFTIAWAEHGGPVIERPPEREGFGTLLAHRSVKHDLGGTIGADWARDGLRIRLSLPLERLGR